MKTKTKAHRGRPNMDKLIAEGVRRYEQLQQQFYGEMAGNRDLQKLEVLLPEMQLLRQRLASYGVRVSP